MTRTSTGEAALGVAASARDLVKVYGKGDYVGSLVVPTGLDRTRPTNWTGTQGAPTDTSWAMFPGLVERFGLRVFMPTRVAGIQ